MWAVVFRVNDIAGTERRYKNIEIARKHLRRLQKRYSETKFNLKQVNRKLKGGF